MMSSLSFTLPGDDHVDDSTPLSVNVDGVGLPRSFAPALEVQEPSPHQHSRLEQQQHNQQDDIQGDSLQDLGGPSARDLKRETRQHVSPLDVVSERSTSREQRRSSLGHLSEVCSKANSCNGRTFAVGMRNHQRMLCRCVGIQFTLADTPLLNGLVS